MQCGVCGDGKTSTGVATDAERILLNRTIGIDGVRKAKVDEPGAEQQNDQGKDAAFWSGGGTGEPIRALHRTVEKSAYAEKAAVGCAIDKGLCPVPGCVESGGKPEISGAPNHQAEQQAGGYDLQNAEDMFSAVTEMRDAEDA